MKRIDLTGQAFGRLTVVSEAPRRRLPSGQVQTMWWCVCQCGNEKAIPGHHLRAGRIVSCGCFQKDLLRQRRDEEVQGKRFGRLVALEKVGFRHQCAIWLCRCDCGNLTEVRSTSLRKFTTQSCGCLNVERTVEANTREVVSYIGAHARVARERGPAKGHECVDCGRTAADWSYTGGAPDERIGSDPYALRYSCSPEFYVPRCRRCHLRYDRAMREGESA